MFTLFTTPKAFRGHIGTIQLNAIKSWTLLRPTPEIIIFGKDEGVESAALECDVRCIPDVERNEFGTPVLSDLFQQAEAQATYSVLCYVNADILLLPDFSQAVHTTIATFQRFLMVGRRWDVDIREPINFGDLKWQTSVRTLAIETDRQRPQEWIDYFVFTRGLGRHLPRFAIGRTCWDNWLIWHARTQGASVIDASESTIAVHQNHDYAHHPLGEEGAWQGQEAKENLRLSGGRTHLYTITNSTHYIAPTGEIRRVSLKRYLKASLEPISAVLFDVLVHRTGSFRHRVGLHRKNS